MEKKYGHFLSDKPSSQYDIMLTFATADSGLPCATVAKDLLAEGGSNVEKNGSAVGKNTKKMGPRLAINKKKKGGSTVDKKRVGPLLTKKREKKTWWVHC